jgi:hypothetical protein
MSKNGAMHGMVHKLDPIVSLKAFDGKIKLGADKRDKINNVLMNLRFVLKGKRPTIMHKLI